MISTNSIREVIRGIWQKDILLREIADEYVPVAGAQPELEGQFEEPQIEDIAASAASAADSQSPTPGDLYRKAQRKLASGEHSPWIKNDSRNEVVDDMRIFATHPALLSKIDIEEPGFRSKAGEVRPYIAPGSMFVNYLSSYADSQGPLFNKMIRDIYKMLSMASLIGDQEKIEEFFVQFPPRTIEELQCLPGSIARFDAVLTAMTKKTPIESLFYQCHYSVLSRLRAEGIKCLKAAPSLPDDPGNQSYNIHVGVYVEHILGFRSVLESDEVDSYSMLIPKFLTATFESRVLDSYGKLFNDELSKVLRSEAFIAEQDKAFLREIIQSAIQKANQVKNSDGFGSLLPDSFDLFSLQFDEFMSVESVDGRVFEGDNSSRIYSALSNLVSDIYNYHGEGVNQKDVKSFFSQFCSKLGEGDDALYQIDLEKLQVFASQRRVDYFKGEIAARHLNHRAFNIKVLNSEIAKKGIYELLSSRNIGEVKSAIDALSLLSEDVKGAATIHFIETVAFVDSQNGIDIISLIGKMIENKDGEFDFLHKDDDFTKVYLPKLTLQSSGSYSRSGLKQRVISLLGEYQGFLKNRSGARSRAVTQNLNLLFKLSTEELQQFINTRFFNRLGYEKDFLQKVISLASARADGSQIFAKILVGAPSEFLDAMMRYAPRMVTRMSCKILPSDYVKNATPDRLNFFFSQAIATNMSEEVLISLLDELQDKIRLPIKNSEEEGSILHLSISNDKLDLAKAIAEKMTTTEHLEVARYILEDYEGPLNIAIARITDYQTDEEFLPEASEYEDYDLVVDLISRDFALQGGDFKLPEFYGYIIRSETLSSDQKEELLSRLISLGKGHEVNNFVAFNPLDAFTGSVDDPEVDIDRDDLGLIKILIAADCYIAEPQDEEFNIIDSVFNSTSISVEEKKSFISFLYDNGIDLKMHEVLKKLILSSSDNYCKACLLELLLQNKVDLSQTFFDTDCAVDDVESLGILYFASQQKLDGFIIFKELLEVGCSLDFNVCRGIINNGEIEADFKEYVTKVEDQHHAMTQEEISLTDLDIINNAIYSQGRQLFNEEQDLSRSALFYRNKDGVTMFESLAEKFIAEGGQGCSFDFIEKLDEFVFYNRRLIGEDLASRLDELNAKMVVSMYNFPSMDEASGIPLELDSSESGISSAEDGQGSSSNETSPSASPYSSSRSVIESPYGSEPGASSPDEIGPSGKPSYAFGLSPKGFPIRFEIPKFQQSTPPNQRTSLLPTPVASISPGAVIAKKSTKARER